MIYNKKYIYLVSLPTELLKPLESPVMRGIKSVFCYIYQVVLEKQVRTEAACGETNLVTQPYLKEERGQIWSPIINGQ